MGAGDNGTLRHAAVPCDGDAVLVDLEEVFEQIAHSHRSPCPCAMGERTPVGIFGKHPPDAFRRHVLFETTLLPVASDIGIRRPVAIRGERISARKDVLNAGSRRFRAARKNLAAVGMAGRLEHFPVVRNRMVAVEVGVDKYRDGAEDPLGKKNQRLDFVRDADVHRNDPVLAAASRSGKCIALFFERERNLSRSRRHRPVYEPVEPTYDGPGIARQCDWQK